MNSLPSQYNTKFWHPIKLSTFQQASEMVKICIFSFECIAFKFWSQQNMTWTTEIAFVVGLKVMHNRVKDILNSKLNFIPISAKLAISLKKSHTQKNVPSTFSLYLNLSWKVLRMGLTSKCILFFYHLINW